MEGHNEWQNVMKNLNKAVGLDDITTVRETLSKHKKMLLHSSLLQIKSLLKDKNYIKEEIMELIVDFAFKGIHSNLEKRLIVAVIMGNLQRVKILLKNGAKLVKDCEDGFPSRYIFCRKNINVRKKMIELLISYGYDTKFRTKSGCNVFDNFCRFSVDKFDTDAVEIAEVFFTTSDIPIKRLDKLLLYSIFCQNIDLVSFFIKKHASVNLSNKSGISVLFWAVHHNNVDLVDLLISSGADVNIGALTSGETPLHHACFSNDEKVIGLLIRKGATLSIKSKSGETPLNKLRVEKKNYNKCLLVMMKEFSRLKYENLPVCEEDMDFLNNSTKAQEYFHKCIAELKEMSSSQLYGTYSYYSLFKKLDGLKRLSNLAKNKEFVKEFEKNSKRFPFYKDDLRRILHEAIDVRNRSIIVESTLKSLLGSLFPFLVLKKLSEYLTVEDFLEK